MKKAAIIIVTYNAERYIKPLFDSLNQLNYPKEDFGVFIIDNMSRDRTVLEVKKWIDSKVSSDSNISNIAQINSNKSGVGVLNAKLIEAEENLGFAGGNNAGMRRVLEWRESKMSDNGAGKIPAPTRYDYIILLNQDMEVDPDWLSELVRVANSDDKIGIVQAMMMLWQERDKIYTTGDRLNYLGIGYSSNFQLPIFNFQLRKNIITYAGGAAVLFKREVLEKVGLFDEAFFMYHEDSDLSWRARMAGYEIALAERAVCYHDYQFKRNKKVFYWTEKNRLAFLLKNFEFKTLVLIFSMYIIMDAGMLGYALMTGWFWGKIKAYGWFLKNLGQILEKRKKVQRSRKLSDRDLKKYLVAEIEFGGIENPLLRYVANPMLRLYWAMIKWLI